MTLREYDDETQEPYYLAGCIAFVIFALLGVWKFIEIIIWAFRALLP